MVILWEKIDLAALNAWAVHLLLKHPELHDLFFYIGVEHFQQVVLIRVHTSTVESRTTDFKKVDFEVSSPEVSTRIFISVGVLAVNRSPGIIRCGMCLDNAPMDTAWNKRC